MQRVTRPRGGINEWLCWLPVSLHKRFDYIIRRFFGDPHCPMTPIGNKLMPLPAENCGNAGLSSVLEADAKQIATMARETFEKYGFFLFSPFLFLVRISFCIVFNLLYGYASTWLLEHVHENMLFIIYNISEFRHKKINFRKYGIHFVIFNCQHCTFIKIFPVCFIYGLLDYIDNNTTICLKFVLLMDL